LCHAVPTAERHDADRRPHLAATAPAAASAAGTHAAQAPRTQESRMSTLEKRHIPHTAISALLGGVILGGLGLLFGNSPGLVIGVVVGAAAGALVGHRLTERADPRDSVGHFEDIYTSMSYYEPGMEWKDYEPAYRLGLDSYRSRGGRSFDDMDAALGARWLKQRGESRLDWNQARAAVQHVWRDMDQTRQGSARAS